MEKIRAKRMFQNTCARMIYYAYQSSTIQAIILEVTVDYNHSILSKTLSLLILFVAVIRHVFIIYSLLGKCCRGNFR